MPLRESEVAQCEYCEAYHPLGELDGVTVQDGAVQAIIAVEEFGEYERYESPWVGRCPDCGNDVFQRNIR